MGACASSGCSSPARVAQSPPSPPLALPCGGAAGCAGCVRVAALHVFWDVENAGISHSGRASAADVAAALVEEARRLAHDRRGAAVTDNSADVGAGAGPGLVAVVPHRFPAPLRKSLHLAGIVAKDAGDKRGAVDIALKDLVNDVVVDFALRRRRAALGGAPTFLFIASGDGDFAGDVRRARRAGLRVGLIYPAASPAGFIRLADLALPWTAVLERAERIAEAGPQPSGLAAAGLPRGGAPSPPPASPSSSSSSSSSLSSSLSPRAAEACRDFVRGRCARGAACRYSHVTTGPAEESSSGAEEGESARERAEGMEGTAGG